MTYRFLVVCPLGRLLVGHATADIWLTGGDVRAVLRNTISRISVSP